MAFAKAVCDRKAALMAERRERLERRRMYEELRKEFGGDNDAGSLE